MGYPSDDTFAEAHGWRQSAGPAPMGMNDYQQLAAGTAGDCRLETMTLGLAGEAGEVADLVKKHIGHGHTLTNEKLTDELGDVLWYVAMLAHVRGITLEAVAEANTEKLKRRYPNGFDPAISQARVSQEAAHG